MFGPNFILMLLMFEGGVINPMSTLLIYIYIWYVYRKGVISNCRAIGLVFDASPKHRLEPYQATKPGREETWKGNWVMFIQLRIHI